MDNFKNSWCPICEGDAKTTTRTGGDWHEFDCRLCGTFRITGTAMAMCLARSPDERKAAHAAAVRRRSTINGNPMISAQDFGAPRFLHQR
jgi:hypothetical protein